MFNASRARSVYRFFDSCQPTIRRENTSMTNAAYTHPENVCTYVMSATQRRFGAGAVKPRSTRSRRRSDPVPRVVVRGTRSLDTPRSPAVRMRRSTVQRATRRPPTPPSRASWAQILRLPYTP